MTYTVATRRSLDPFTGLRRINQLLDESVNVWNAANGSPIASWVPAADITEHQGALTLVAELPGVKPEDVKVSVENGVLTLAGEKKGEPVDTSNGRVHVLERSYGQFTRTFVLPKTVDVERITANFSHGLLTVTLPKAEKAMAREITVNVN